MEAPHPTAGWENVGDRFYRKTQLYTAVFDRDLDLDNYIVAGAPYGGAIGMVTSINLFHFPSSEASSWLLDVLRLSQHSNGWPNTGPAALTETRVSRLQPHVLHVPIQHSQHWR